MNNLLISTDSAQKTKDLGKEISGEFRGESLNIFLDGELGAGKTTFLQGLGEGLGIKDQVISPSFQLVRKYSSPKALLLHIDLYRMSSSLEIQSMGWWDLLSERAVTAVEWAERAKNILPDKGVFINIRYSSETSREIEIARERKNISWY